MKLAIAAVLVAIGTGAAAQTPSPQAPPPANVNVNATVGPNTTGATGSFGPADLIFGYGFTARSKAGKLRRDVGALMADGRCDEAKALALRGGDMQLAQQAATICTPAAAPSTPHP